MNIHIDDCSWQNVEFVPVIFEYSSVAAKTVCVAGTFNQWDPSKAALFLRAEGYWSLRAALATGVYEYCLVVDGKWLADPLNQVSVPNSFGGRNSVITVAHTPSGAHRVAAEQTPIGNRSENEIFASRKRIEAICLEMALPGNEAGRVNNL